MRRGFHSRRDKESNNEGTLRYLGEGSVDRKRADREALARRVALRNRCDLRVQDFTQAS